MAYQRKEMQLGGEVEIDGMYIGGHFRRAEDCVDRRMREHRNPDRLCALAILGRAPGGGTVTGVIRDEDRHAAWAAVRDHVSREATVLADKHSSYDGLLGLNRTKR